VYALSPSGELRRVAVVSPSGEPGLRALPGQLGIVRCADVDQVPLVVLTAAHPLFTQAAITHAGLHHTIVRDRLLREFIVRLDLAADADLTAAVDSMCIAPTLMPLQLAVLDRWAGAHLRDDRCDWVDCDLLQQAVHLPFIAHLQQIVRVRRRQVIAQTSETADGLCTFRLGSRCATSFVRAKALGDLLLAHVWDEFYRDSGVEPVLRSDYADVATDAEQRAALQRAREAASRGPMRPIFRFHTVRRWGITAWVGGVLPPGDAR